MKYVLNIGADDALQELIEYIKRQYPDNSLIDAVQIIIFDVLNTFTQHKLMGQVLTIMDDWTVHQVFQQLYRWSCEYFFDAGDISIKYFVRNKLAEVIEIGYLEPPEAPNRVY